MKKNGAKAFMGHIFKRTGQVAQLLLLLVCVAVPFLVIYQYGFPISATMSRSIDTAYHSMLAIEWVLIVILFLTQSNSKLKRKSGKMAGKMVGFAIFTAVVVFDFGLYTNFLRLDWFLSIFTGNLIVMLVALVVSVVEISRYITSLLGRRTNPAMILAGSFAVIIVIGSLLLMLPNCTVSGISYTDSLFVSTSAVCVTGLTPIDVATQFTTTGLVVLLFLIQIGGLGIMTITSFFGLFFAGSNSFAGQMVVGDLLSTDRLGSLFKMLIQIIVVTLSIEAIGALFLYIAVADSGHFTQGQAVWFGVFHSISAFCNAGFSTLSGNLSDDKIVAINSIRYVVSMLIVFGGIGFPIFFNFLSVARHKIANVFRRVYGMRPVIRPHLVSLNTYIVIKTTMILILVGWGAFLALEWNVTLGGMSLAEKLSQAFLMSASPRTAGFSGVSLTGMLPASILLTIILMWIGGAPQSTAGGIKITTFYTAVKNIFTSSAGRDNIEVHRRAIPNSSVRRAFAVIMLSIVFITISVVALSLLEPGVELTRLVYEVVSAISTVGLSLDLTPHLGLVSKYILILLMFVGRVGLISIFVLFIGGSRHKAYSYPNENILIS